jgi:murein DD-endopeptidase MepM/ murein hydrolase activator NlpD
LTTAALLLLCVPVAFASWRTLEQGDRGDDVTLVQQALTRVGYSTDADGVFGSGTARMVRKYERRVEIAVDGRVSRGQARGLFKRAGMDPSVVDAPDPSGSEGRAAPRSSSGDGFFPVQGDFTWGRGFGDDGGHQGVDVMADCGLPMVVPEGGEVRVKKSEGSGGNYVVITAPSGEDQVFMHLQEPATVDVGDTLAPGDRIGEVGQTGNATACHLHFEIWTKPGWYEGGAARDPKPDLKSWAGQ